MRRCLVAVFAGVAIAACGSGAGRATVPSNPSVTTTSSSASAQTTSTTTPPCAHSPVAHVESSYAGFPNPPGASLDYLAPHVALPIHDGDGNTIQGVGLAIAKTGSGGTVTLRHGGSDDEVVVRGVADFDGDARSDVLVDLYESGTSVATYIVAGTVAPGTHDPATVGVRVPRPHVDTGEVAGFATPVGDQDNDGADDVSFGPELYSGRQLVGLPAGQPLPSPFRTLTSMYVGLLQLDPAGPPAFVVPDPATSSLQVLDDRSDRLGLDAPSTDLAGAVVNGARALGWLANGDHVVQFAYSTRSGTTGWRWNLDAACGA